MNYVGNITLLYLLPSWFVFPVWIWFQSFSKKERFDFFYRGEGIRKGGGRGREFETWCWLICGRPLDCDSVCLSPHRVVFASLVDAPLLIGRVKYPSVWSSLRVVYSTLYEAPTILPMFSAYYIFNSLLICLQMLHVIWSFMILRITVSAVAAGKVIIVTFLSPSPPPH